MREGFRVLEKSWNFVILFEILEKLEESKKNSNVPTLSLFLWHVGRYVRSRPKYLKAFIYK